MVLRLYTVYDRVAQEAGSILIARNDGMALRSMRQALIGNQSEDDYQLWYLGDYDTEMPRIAGLSVGQKVSAFTVEKGDGV